MFDNPNIYVLILYSQRIFSMIETYDNEVQFINNVNKLVFSPKYKSKWFVKLSLFDVDYLAAATYALIY